MKQKLHAEITDRAGTLVATIDVVEQSDGNWFAVIAEGLTATQPDTERTVTFPMNGAAREPADVIRVALDKAHLARVMGKLRESLTEAADNMRVGLARLADDQQDGKA